MLNLLAPLTLLADMDTGVSIEGVVRLAVYLIVVGAIFWLLWFLVNWLALPEPFNKIVRGVLMVLAVFILINVLLGFIGHPVIYWTN